MNRNHKAEDHNSRAKRYLRDTESSHPFDAQSGLYQPKREHVQQPIHVEVHSPANEDNPKSNGAEKISAIAQSAGVLVAIFTLIGLAVTVAFAIGQWHEAHRTANASITATETAQESFEETRVANTRQNTQARLAREDAYLSAKESTKRAREALQATIDNFHQDQRAWVGVDIIQTVPAVPAPDKPLQVNVGFKNTGKTPAFEVSGSVVSEPEPSGVRPKVAYAQSSNKLYGMVPPNGSVFTTVNVTWNASTKEPMPLTQAAFAEIQAGSEVIFIHGRLTYNDVFRAPHWTEYCFKLLPTGAFTSCNEHNDADRSAIK